MPAKKAADKSKIGQGKPGRPGSREPPKAPSRGTSFIFLIFLYPRFYVLSL